MIIWILIDSNSIQAPTRIAWIEQSSYFLSFVIFQVDVRGILQQVPCSPPRPSESGAGPGLVQTDPAWAHLRPRPVLLWKNQSIFPSWSGGSSGEAESWEAACGCSDHPEPGQRVAVTHQIHQDAVGNCHYTEILQRSSGQTVRLDKK